jgi:hypothetical protein
MGFGDFCRSAPPLHRGHQHEVPLDGPSIHLIEGRFGAAVMDEPHLLAAARYIALNLVVAGLVSSAEDWPWLSARAHLAGEDDERATVAPLRALIPDFCGTSHRTGQPCDDGADRASAQHRTTAWGAGMDRGARASARPPPRTRQTRTKDATGP